jgi:hypothetical protein
MTRVPTPSGRRAPADASPAPLLYLYAILDAPADLEAQLTTDPIPGLDPREALFALPVGPLRAIVSRVPAEAFQDEPLNALLSDLPRLAPYLVSHDAAVSALVRRGHDLIPMSFGVIFRDAERLIGLLTQRVAEFEATLARVRGKREWGVKLFVATDLLLDAAAGATDELRALTSEIALAAPGRAYLLGKRRERLAASAAEALAGEALADVLAHLGALSAAVHREAVESGEGGGPQLLLKAAFLVDVRCADRFQREAERLRSAWAPRGSTLELSGPWAPYSFVGGGRARA